MFQLLLSHLQPEDGSIRAETCRHFNLIYSFNKYSCV
jgi:hypothetical protein